MVKREVTDNNMGGVSILSACNSSKSGSFVDDVFSCWHEDKTNMKHTTTIIATDIILIRFFFITL